MKYELTISPNQFYYSLYRRRKDRCEHGQNLASIYSRALVKALVLANGILINNSVPEELRTMTGHCLKSGRKLGMGCSVFHFGKYQGRSVKQVLQRDREYLEWYFREVDPYDNPKFGKFREPVIELKAWILWYRPELAINVCGGSLFSTYAGKVC